MTKSSFKNRFFLGLSTMGLIIFIQVASFLGVEKTFYSLNFLAGNTPVSDSVVIVAIDPKSIGVIGRWPWPREVQANLYEKIKSGQPRVVALDLLFPKGGDPKTDERLQSVFQEMNNLVLPFRAESFLAGDPQGQPEIEKNVGIHRFLRVSNPAELNNILFYSAKGFISSDSFFATSAKRSGFLNVATRKFSNSLLEVIHVIQAGESYFPSFALAAVAEYLHVTPSQLILDGEGIIHMDEKSIDLTTYAASLFLNFRGRAGTIPTVSAGKVISGEVDPTFLKDKLVFVGITDSGTGSDFFQTPVGSQFPGVEIWATAAMDLLDETWIRKGGGLPSLFNWFFVFLLFPGLVLSPGKKKKWKVIVTGAVLVLLSIFAGLAIFTVGHYFWDPTRHICAFFFSLVFLIITKDASTFVEVGSLDLEPKGRSELDTLPPPVAEDMLTEIPHTLTATHVFENLLELDLSCVADATQEIPTGILEDGMTGEEQLQEKRYGYQHTRENIERFRQVIDGQIIKALGSGGIADVYLVWKEKLEMYRAVKVLQPTHNISFSRMFETEVKIFAKLIHPNIVTCYGLGEWGTLPYIEMEFINGDSLDTVLKKFGSLSMGQTLAVGILICRALHYAHNQVITMYGKTHKGIVHRDLKPANILLSRSGRIKLADFGIASPGTGTKNTVDNAGTVPYLAPEQFKGGEFSLQSDIYALGATLYELFTGKKAFPQKNLKLLTEAKRNGSYKKIMASKKSVERGSAIIEQAMNTQPEKRYTGADVMAKDMEECLKSLEEREYSAYLTALAKKCWHE